MNLVVDIGNSFLKAAVFKKDKLIASEQIASEFRLALQNFVNKFPEISKCILSETGKPDKTLEAFLRATLPFFLKLNSTMPLPIRNLYKTPETLGKDRLAAAVGAHDIFPENDVLIVDAGTAITYDLVKSTGEYLGGAISPGLNMRYKALHTFTNKLPLLSPEADSIIQVADTTAGSIHTGIILGILHEINGYIQNSKQSFRNLQVILTGGDAVFFEKKVKSSIFVDLNLVLRGLNKILIFNA